MALWDERLAPASGWRGCRQLRTLADAAAGDRGSEAQASQEPRESSVYRHAPHPRCLPITGTSPPVVNPIPDFRGRLIPLSGDDPKRSSLAYIRLDPWLVSVQLIDLC